MGPRISFWSLRFFNIEDDKIHGIKSDYEWEVPINVLIQPDCWSRMTTLEDIQKDKLKQAALYLDEISDKENKEFWRLFISKLPREIYTEDQIETFAEEGNTTTGSPSFKLLCDLRQRRLLFNYFIRCLEIIKCMKAFNLFIQPGEFIYIHFLTICWSITDLYLYHTHIHTTVPVILEHPSSQSLQCGDVLVLRCRWGCVPSPPQYQWYWNDIPLLDQTDSVLKISNVNTSHTGDYKCVVTNPYINDHILNRSVISHTVKVEVLEYSISGK